MSLELKCTNYASVVDDKFIQIYYRNYEFFSRLGLLIVEKA